MKKREIIKGKMMKKAEEVIEELLDWNEEKERPTLREMEEIILRLRKDMSEEMLGGVIEIQETVRKEPGSKCGCGKETHNKGIKKKNK